MELMKAVKITVSFLFLSISIIVFAKLIWYIVLHLAEDLNRKKLGIWTCLLVTFGSLALAAFWLIYTDSARPSLPCFFLFASGLFWLSSFGWSVYILIVKIRNRSRKC